MCSLQGQRSSRDRVGQPAGEMAKGSGRAARPKGTQAFVPLALAAASATEATRSKDVGFGF